MKTRRKGSGMGDGQVHTFGPRFPQVRANEYADDQSAQLTTGTQVAIAVAVIIDARVAVRRAQRLTRRLVVSLPTQTATGGSARVSLAIRKATSPTTWNSGRFIDLRSSSLRLCAAAGRSESTCSPVA